jgi:Rrf2 family protein
MDYLAKILQSLARAALVSARRGPGGGFVLSRPAAAISVLAVINAVDSVQRIRTCPLKLQAHAASLCPLHRKLDDALRSVEETFAATSLAELLAAPAMTIPECKEGGLCHVQVAN